ncbi:MAG: hypothetical protein PVF58_21240 [Candidatus Methanofastidiosia archaeon]
MKAFPVITLAIIVCTLTVSVSVSVSGDPAENDYDVILVRDDLPADYVVAQAYAHKEGIPIVTTHPVYLESSVRRELQGFKSQGAESILIIGGADTAISEDIEQELLRMGYRVHRLWDWDRIGTAARVAIELWESSRYAVIANADVIESYLIASSISINVQAPILFTTENELPETSIQALETLQVETVYLVGPKISSAVENQLTELHIEITRMGKDIKIRNIPSITDEEPIFHALLKPFPLFMGGICGVAVGYFICKLSRKVGKREIPMFVLTEDEQKVVEAIGDGVKQEELPELTGFSRPKITRIISDLESKQIITRKKYGKTYKIQVMKSIVED